MNYRVKKALEKYAKAHNVRIVDFQQVGAKLFDLWYQVKVPFEGCYFSEIRWKRETLAF